MGLDYSADGFKKTVIPCMLFIGIAIIMVVLNISRHLYATYDPLRRHKILNLLYWELICIIITLGCFWIYRYSELIMIGVEILLCIPIIYFYIYMKLTLLEYLKGYFARNPEQLDELCVNPIHKEMFRGGSLGENQGEVIPQGITYGEYFRILNIATAYCYMLEGRARFCIC